MSKKFGKFFMVATLGALAGGAYYFLKKKDTQADSDFDEDDDFDEFDEDLDSDDASAKTEAERKYVDLDLTKAAEKVEEKAGEFKEGLEAAKAEATDKIVGAADGAAKAAGEAAAKVEEFFDDDDNSLDAM